MNKRFFLCLLAVVGIGCVGFGAAQQGKIPPEVWQKAREKGVVRVLVQLDAPTKPEGKLSKEAAQAQRKAVAGAQDELLAELAGTKHRVGQAFKNIPGLSLEVGLDALAVLERSAHVVKVTEERVFKPLQEQSVPKEGR